MTNIEKLQKKQEANEKRLEKASDKRYNKWLKNSLRFIKRKIKQAVKKGDGEVRIESNDLYRVVKREIAYEFKFNYLAKEIIETLHKEGYHVFYYPGCDWVSAYIEVGWEKVDALQKFEKECIYVISMKYDEVREGRYYISIFDLKYDIERYAKERDFAEAVQNNVSPEDYVKLKFRYLFE